MHVELNDLLKINNIESYNLSFPLHDKVMLILKKAYEAQGISVHNTVTADALKILKDALIKKLVIHTTPKYISYLRNNDPAHHLQPTGRITYKELLELYTDYTKMNQKSDKKRSLKVLEDVYALQYSANKKIIVEYGSVLTDKAIEMIRRYSDMHDQVDYRDNENGVLVYVPSVKDFSLKVDIFAIIASLNVDIYDASSVQETVELYHKKSPKLVILGNLGGNIDAKRAFLQIVETDPYVKKLDYAESPATNRKMETERIERTYYGSYRPLIKSINKPKEPLPDEIKNTIRETLNTLRSNWNPVTFIETAYALKQFGRMFNISVQWNYITNLKKNKIGDNW